MLRNLECKVTTEATEVDLLQKHLSNTALREPGPWVDGYNITVELSAGETVEDKYGTQLGQSVIDLSEIAEELPEAQALVDSGWTYANFSLSIATDKPGVAHDPELSDQLASAAPYSFGALADIYVCHPVQEPHQMLVDIAVASTEDGIELPGAYHPSLLPVAIARLIRGDKRELYDTTADRWSEEHVVGLMADIPLRYDDVKVSKSERPVRAVRDEEWAKIAALRDALADHAIKHLGEALATEDARKAGAQRIAALLLAFRHGKLPLKPITY